MKKRYLRLFLIRMIFPTVYSVFLSGLSGAGNMLSACPVPLQEEKDGKAALEQKRDSSGSYTLKYCLETGLENNYAVRISRNQEQVSRNNSTVANAGYLPVVDLSAGYSGTLDNTSSKLRSTEEIVKDRGVFGQSLNAGVSLNWTLFDGFSISTNYQRLQELEKMGETNTRIAIEDFVAEFTAEYYNYIQQKIRLKNFLYAVSLSKERLRIVEERYNIGNFSRLDLQQARVDFNADSTRYMKQQELLHTSCIRLNKLMAEPDVNRQLDIPDSVINVNELLVFDQLWEGTLRVNASLLNAERNQTLASLDLKSVLSRNYPYVRFNAGYGYTYNRYGSGTNLRRGNLGLNFGLSVGFNIFDGNRSRERSNARLAVENASLSRQELELSLRADMENLWQAYQNNIQILRLERENLVAAKENYEIAMERYMLGNLSGIEMREAQKSLLDAEERILTAEYDAKLCEISLLQIGGKILQYMF